MRDRVLRAALGQPVDTTPVWFLRQAGRYLPEYRRLRERYSLAELCREPELAAQVTLQPLRRMDVDAAILFTDLLVPLWGMGL
ncbi:MAG: uroporphyrinogen decarboxylase family protein, partial [Armatimonadota bacterium]|nr:uroporphyrinogen decarboxylase family protein [Armatimonadota bacterium]